MRRGFLLAGFVVFAIGLSLVAVTAHSLWLTSASRSWPSVDGQIIGQRSVASGVRSNSEKGTLRQTFSTRYEYRYVVDGREYRSNREADPDGPSHVEEQALYETRRPYPPAARVEVFYHPEKPETALIDQDRLRLADGVALLGVGGFLTAVGFGTVLTFLRPD